MYDSHFNLYTAVLSEESRPRVGQYLLQILVDRALHEGQMELTVGKEYVNYTDLIYKIASYELI